MNTYQYNDFRIEVFDDQTFTLDSADNKNSYLHHYFGDHAKDFPILKHGINVYKEEEIIVSCIVISSAGATGIHENSSLLCNDRLLVCCCDTVFCLALPQIHLNWHVRCDMATCFQI
ncbi:hypothetical protein [Chitinophaga niabensis]|uniref:hypothetical protein n=1 Tax=Chitinophaga niabensis TaxID=536979 RepID=UPI001160FBF2|nr:hypothetical protein [Chitinophaga niabensis]